MFTAIADVTMGYLVTQGTVDAWPLLVALVASSAALYLAGMVLNDVFDATLDAQERPTHPFPPVASHWQPQSGWVSDC